VLQALERLIALQALDTAAETARRRLADLPAVEQAIARKITVAEAAVDVAKAAHAENQRQRRELEKQVAAVDARLTRFDEHKASVKTNHEYTALLHEIATAKAEKDGIEEQILALMESADGIQASVRDAEGVVASVNQEAKAGRAALAGERAALEAELARLAGAKVEVAATVDKPTLARYEQLLKQRKMVAVAEMQGDLCMACHVRLRPAVTQQVRRNAELVTCDSCQRLLYFKPAPADTATAPPA
jgi:predicted  nucleic acid-binding Zn-ribbon protein